MKVMNILVISFVMVVGSLFLFNEKAAAEEGVVIGDIAIMHTFNTATNTLEILIYHEPSNAFLLYGYSSKTKQGLRLLHVRRLEYDFAFAEKTKKGLDFKKNGYDMDRIKELIKLKYTGERER
jgi:hypothetical protein